MYKYNPTDLYYLISFDCNQRCSKCSHWKMEYKEELLNINDFIKNIEGIDTFKELCIVGGEPLIYKENIYKILESINSTSIRTTLITNGVLMDKAFIDFVKDFNIHIVISIDTIDRNFWKYVRGVDSYNLVMNNLKYAVEILDPNKLSIQSVLAEETREHVEKVSDYAKELGLYHSVQLYVQDGFDGSWTPVKIDKEAQNADKDNTQQCFAAGRNLSIMPNGDVFTCFQQNMIPGCQQPIGNLKHDNLSKLLNSNYINEILSKMRTCNLPCKVLKCNQME